MKRVLNSIVALSVAALAFGFSSNSLAKSINLYDQPKADGKVINTVDSNAGIITIFKPKEGEWVKVADPRNGNVGWAKLADLKGVGLQFNIIQGGNGAHSYQIIEYDGNTALTPEQINKVNKQMQVQQQVIQQRQQVIQDSVNKMMNDIFNTMHQYWMSIPMVMPEKTTVKNTNQPSAAVKAVGDNTTKSNDNKK